MKIRLNWRSLVERADAKYRRRVAAVFGRTNDTKRDEERKHSESSSQEMARLMVRMREMSAWRAKRYFWIEGQLLKTKAPKSEVAKFRAITDPLRVLMQVNCDDLLAEIRKMDALTP